MASGRPNSHSRSGSRALCRGIPAPRMFFGLLCPERAERDTESGGRRAPIGAPFRVAFDAPTARRLGEPVRVVANLPSTALYALDGHRRGPTALGDRSAHGRAPRPYGPGRRPGGENHSSARGPPRVDGLSQSQRPRRPDRTRRLPALLCDSRGRLAGSPVAHLRFECTHARCSTGAGEAVADRRRTDCDRGRRLRIGFGARRLHQTADSRSRVGRRWAAAVSRPAEFTYRTSIEKPGVYSLIARIHGEGEEIWSIDGSYRVAIRPEGAIESFARTHVRDPPPLRWRARDPRSAPQGRWYRHAASGATARAGCRLHRASRVTRASEAAYRINPSPRRDAYRSLSRPLFRRDFEPLSLAPGRRLPTGSVVGPTGTRRRAIAPTMRLRGQMMPRNPAIIAVSALLIWGIGCGPRKTRKAASPTTLPC